MPADAYSSGIGVLLMGTGNDNNAWGVNANSSIFQIFEDAISGRLVSAVTGGTLDLSTPAPPTAVSLARYKVLAFTGTLSSTQIVKVPAISKSWHIENNCTADIYLQTPSGTQITIPTGTVKHVYCDGTNVKRMDYDDIGKVSMFGGQSVPAGHFECAGSSLLRTSYPELFTKIGTVWGTVDLNHFTLPNMWDTGRFPRSRQPGVTEAGVTWLQANQNASHSHTISYSSTTLTENVAHNHSVSIQTGGVNTLHTHAYQEFVGSGTSGGNAGTAWSGTFPTANTGTDSVDHSHLVSGNTTTESANHDHSFSISTTSSASGGAEARPEAIVFRFCIKY